MLSNQLIQIKQITSQQLAEQLKHQPKGWLLLDVRSNDEVAICSIADALHIPMQLIPNYLDKIPDDKTIVVYCHHGIRSLNVAHYLVENGFEPEQIINLQGGIDEWALSVDLTMKRY